LTAPDQFKDRLPLVRTYKQGEIYLADDKYVSTNLKKFFGWEEKLKRPIIILEDDDSNKNPHAQVLLVAPLTSTSPPTTLDIPIRQGTGQIAEDSVIQISLLFPIPKKCIGDYVGEIPIALKEQIRKHLLKKFGIIPLSP